MKQKKVIKEAAAGEAFVREVEVKAEKTASTEGGDVRDLLTARVEGDEEEKGEVGEDEEEDFESTHFDEIIEVEDVFGAAESVIEGDEKNQEGEGELGGDDEEEEEEEEEEDESTGEESGDESQGESEDEVEGEAQHSANKKNVSSDNQIGPKVPVSLGNINFGEDFFPALSASGPKKARKAWPAPTNENIVRECAVKDDVKDSVEEDVSTAVNPGVMKWSSIASISVAKAVITANDHKHTTANSSYNSSRDWSRKPKTYKKNNASMPVKLEIQEGDLPVENSISVLPSKVRMQIFYLHIHICINTFIIIDYLLLMYGLLFLI